MKRLGLVSVLVLMLTVGARAGEIGFGVKGGLNLSNLYGSGLEPLGLGFKGGVAGGVYANISFIPFLTLQPEILYVMNGASRREGDLELSLNYDYVQVPLLLRLNVPIADTVIPTFYGGPYVAFLTGSTWKVTFQDNELLSLDMKDITESVDLGLVFGGAVELKINPIVFFFEGRYNVGLVSVAKEWADPDWEDNEGFDIKNHSIMLMAGAGVSFSLF